METTKIFNFIIFLVLIVITYFIFKSNESNLTNDYFNTCEVNINSIKNDITTNFVSNTAKMYTDKINCIDDCKLKTIYKNNHDINCKDQYDKYCAQACDLKNKDQFSQIKTSLIGICNSPDDDNSNCKWLEKDEYRPPSKLSGSDIIIETNCQDDPSSKTDQILKSFIIFWKTPASFHPIKKYILEVKRNSDENFTRILHYITPNNLDKNHFILKNKKDSFFYIDQDLDTNYELYLYSINENGLSLASDVKIINKKSFNCNVQSKKELMTEKGVIDFKQDKVNDFLRKLTNK